MGICRDRANMLSRCGGGNRDVAGKLYYSFSVINCVSNTGGCGVREGRFLLSLSVCFVPTLA